MRTCPVCGNLLRSYNKSGYCRDHNNYKYFREPNADPGAREKYLQRKHESYVRNKEQHSKKVKESEKQTLHGLSGIIEITINVTARKSGHELSNTGKLILKFEQLRKTDGERELR